MRLDGAHVLLTGASRGIGLTTARLLTERGAHLTLVARNPERLDAVARELGATPLAADLTRTEDLARVVEEAEAARGPVDALINNAALMTPGPLVQLTAEQIRDVVAANLTAPLELARQALERMLPRRTGTIVNVTSLIGHLAARNIIPYCATKSALATATEALRRELDGTGVQAQLVVLGYVQTDMMDDAHADPVTKAQSLRLKHMPSLTPESVAAGIVRGLERDRKVTVLPPMASPLHRFRMAPQRLVDGVMAGIPRSL